MRSIYAEKSLEELPRLLSCMDRNPFSPTYGCLSREFWLTRVRDFPDALAQFGTLSLALVYSHSLPGGERYYHNQEMLAWTLAGIRYWMKIQHRDGSYDEFYPNERGWAGPTGFLLYAMLRSYEVLGDAFPRELRTEFFDAVKRSAWFLATRDETGVLANHHAMALLPVYQAYRHLTTEDPAFAAILLPKFRERLDDFLRYHFDEGWSLEYDGIDPGYLSATVSFLSKMQRYMDGREPWGAKIDEVIRQSVDTLSYFFYPNGSYAGTLGSRQTLHFYAHGCELQAATNPTAAACAAFGQRSLAEGKLVPPGIQDDRYYLYRTAELLEAFIDGRDYAEVDQLPHQCEPFEKYFEQARIYIRNTPTHYALLNLAKGGVLKVYDKRTRTLAYADDGIIATLAKGSVLTTQWIGPEYRVERTGDQFVVYGSFHKVPFKYFTPVTMMGFRAFMLLTGWNARFADLIKGVIRNMLMTKSSRASLEFERRFTFTDDAITVMHAITAKKQVAHLRIGGQFAARYVPQSRYFQPEELGNPFWTADPAFLETLRTKHFASLCSTFTLADNRSVFAPTKQPLKIAIVVNGRAHESGVTTFINTISEALRGCGQQVDVVTMFEVGRLRKVRVGFVQKSDAVLRGKDLATIAAYIVSKIIIGARLFHSYLRRRYDLFYGIDMSTALVAMPYKKFLGKPVMHFVLGEVHRELVDQGKIRSGGVAQKFMRREEKRAMERSDRNLIGNMERIPYINDISKHPAKIIFFKTPIDSTIIHPGQGTRDSYGIPPDAKTVLYVGRLAPRKGVQLALEAFREIVGKHPDWVLLLAGIGPERIQLEEYAEKHGIKDSVRFLGSIPHALIGDVFRCADIFVFPSYKKGGIPEPFSHTPLEAMATGLPVIAFRTEFADHRQIMRHLTNCFLVNEGDVQALGKSLEEVLLKRELYQQLSEGGLSEIRDNGWLAEHVAAFFDELNHRITRT